MAIVINGSGTVTGLSVGGLPDGTVDEGTLATDSVTAAKIPASLENTFVSGRKNLIINGDMRVQQRGTASVTSGYFVDRFTLSSCSASAVLTSSTPTEFPTAISVSATSGNPVITQRIESKNCQGLSGQTVTASFYAKNISNATTLYAKLQYAGGADSWGSSTTISEQNLGTLSGSWVKYTASWTVPAGGLNGLALGILCAGSSTFTMGVTGVQLEVGDTATDFEHRSYSEELALCQRYFHKIQTGFVCTGSTGFVFNINFPTTMRTTPSQVHSYGGVSNDVYRLSNGATPTFVPNGIFADTNSMKHGYDFDGGFTAGEGYVTDWEFDSEL